VSKHAVETDRTWFADTRGRAARKLSQVFVACSPVDRFRSTGTPTRSVILGYQAGCCDDLQADLLFCPFTAPLFFEPTVPVVSLVHDLQYLYYPEFFSPDDRHSRNQHFQDAAQRAERLICVSDYVRQTVLDKAVVRPERVLTIRSRLFHRLKEVPAPEADSWVAQLGLRTGQYLLYPANFWKHKNHKMLLSAFGLYRKRNPGSKLKLVCTGAPGQGQKLIEGAARRMGLEKWVHFPGFLPDEEFSAVLQCCCAVIFPSLYEGFGLPVLEAMARGKPVLCSNVTSLPEVAGQAAAYFDPRKPAEIVDAIERITTDHSLVEQLVEAGRQNVAAAEDAAAMAQEYMKVFREIIASGGNTRPSLQGLFADGWIGESLTVSFDKGTANRRLELTLTAPGWLPHGKIYVREVRGKRRHLLKQLRRGECGLFRLALPREAGLVELVFEPTFQPRAHGINQDERWLTCMCGTGRLVSLEGTDQVLWPYPFSEDDQ
jgi:glycosyltransferase involved in cell wall biosynthesis